MIIWQNNDPIFRYVAKRYDIPFTKMKEVMKGKVGELEAGNITCKEFVQTSLEHFGKKLKWKDDPANLITFPFARRAKSRKGVIRIIEKLRKQGYEVDGFSNTNLVHVRLMDRRGWTNSLFDRFFASCTLRSIKPDLNAYRKVLNLIGVMPRDAFIIDNSERNVIGARKAGIKHSIRFHSIAELKKDIKHEIENYRN